MILEYRKTKGRSYGGRRLQLLDTIRGLTLISMILYHASWDVVYILGIDWPWYHTHGAFLWQQSICWTFILLSGFCIPLSTHRFKRGLIVFGGGLLVTAATLVFLPEDRVVFGVLTFLGSAMLLLALVGRKLERFPALAGVPLCAYLFYMFRNINEQILQIAPARAVTIPQSLYHGLAATYLGFTDPGFYSTDYFSLLPWIFLFLTGFYLHLLLKRENLLSSGLMHLDIRPLSFLGRHSLIVYLLHQPAIYMICMLYSMYGR